MRSEKRPRPSGSPSGNGRTTQRSAPPRGAALDGKAPTDALKDLATELRDLRANAAALVAARARLVRAKAKLLLVLAGAGVVLFFAVVAAAVTGAVLLLRGIAGGLAASLGGRAWLGDIIAGAIGLSLLAAGGWLALRLAKRPRKPERERGRGRDAPERFEAAEGLHRG